MNKPSILNKRWLTSMLSRHKRKIVILAFISIIQSICVIGIAKIVEGITDLVYLGEDTQVFTQNFFKKVGILLVLVLLNSVVNYFIITIKAKISAQSCKALRTEGLEKIQNLKIAYMESQEKGSILSKVTNDLTVIESFFNDNVKDIVYLPCNIILLSAWMLLISWKLYLASTLIIPVMMFLAYLINAAVTTLSRQLQMKLGQSTGLIMDAIGGIEVIKTFNLQEKYTERFKNITLEIFHKQLSLVMRIASMTPLLYVLRVIPKVACVITGGYLVMQQEITAGDVIAFLLLVGVMSSNIYMVPNVFAGYKKTAGAVQSLLELFEAPEEKMQRQDVHVKDKPSLSLHHVDFCYEADHPILTDINIALKGPQAVAVVGESGAGKSTIIKMLLGYYFPSKGKLAINGIEVVEETLEKCRAEVAFVSQETYLFADTIYNNIACALETATKEEVYAAAKTANIHDFIMSLENGYDTVIGERGNNLSGGEKQRLALARALLKKSSIILLDEPTSAVDVDSEMKIINAINEIKKDKIVFIISHRLPTIQVADKIFVIKEGTIMEEGSYETLIEGASYFKQMYLGLVD